jgi:hypothetical protein
LIETRQVYLDYLAVPEAEREPFTPPSSSPADYAYDRKRATVAAVSQLMINAEACVFADMAASDDIG